jgi:hypothetical protein
MTKKPSKPAPITRAGCAALRSLKDARLSGVAYHYLPPADGAYYAGGEEGVDTDLAAVVLHLGDRGTTTITWAMSGEIEGLAILEGESYSGIGLEILDAADRDAWRQHIGCRITSIAASWQISGEDCPESLWALRISFAAGSIVIALGTAPTLDYMPNELVVVFDMSLARSYKPSHVTDSSWGAPIESA